MSQPRIKLWLLSSKWIFLSYVKLKTRMQKCSRKWVRRAQQWLIRASSAPYQAGCADDKYGGGLAPEHKCAAPTLRVSPFNETLHIFCASTTVVLLIEAQLLCSFGISWARWARKTQRVSNPVKRSQRARNQTPAWKYEPLNAIKLRTRCPERCFVQMKRSHLGHPRKRQRPVTSWTAKTTNPYEQHLQTDPSRDGILKETSETWLPTQLQTVGKKSKKKKNLSSQAATAWLACTKGTEIIIRRGYDNDIWTTKWTKAAREWAGALNGPEPPSATKQHESKHSIRRQQTEQTLKSAALCRVSTAWKQQRH